MAIAPTTSSSLSIGTLGPSQGPFAYRYVERKMTEAGVLHPQSYQQALWAFCFDCFAFFLR
jgi:hypothetical protein